MKNNFVMIANNSNINDSVIYSYHSDPIMFNFSYTPMYDEFMELKKIQLAVRKHDVFEKDTCLAINLTEWLGHEKDEYFITTIMFLCDMSYKWSYIFVVNSKEISDIKKMFAIIRCYMRGKLVSIKDDLEMNDIIGFLIEKNYSSNAAELFAEILGECCISNAYIKKTIEKATEEMKASEEDKIDVKNIMEYINCEESIINPIIPTNFLEKLNREYKKELEK